MFQVIESPKVFSVTLGTTVTKVNLRPNTQLTQTLNIRITNAHASNLVAFAVVPAGTVAAPVFVAAVGATAGTPVRGNSDCEFRLSAEFDLYIIASAASTPVYVVSTVAINNG